MARMLRARAACDLGVQTIGGLFASASRSRSPDAIPQRCSGQGRLPQTGGALGAAMARRAQMDPPTASSYHPTARCAPSDRTAAAPVRPPWRMRRRAPSMCRRMRQSARSKVRSALTARRSAPALRTRRLCPHRTCGCACSVLRPSRPAARRAQTGTPAWRGPLGRSSPVLTATCRVDASAVPKVPPTGLAAAPPASLPTLIRVRTWTERALMAARSAPAASAPRMPGIASPGAPRRGQRQVRLATSIQTMFAPTARPLVSASAALSTAAEGDRVRASAANLRRVSLGAFLALVSCGGATEPERGTADVDAGSVTRVDGGALANDAARLDGHQVGADGAPDRRDSATQRDSLGAAESGSPDTSSCPGSSPQTLDSCSAVGAACNYGHGYGDGVVTCTCKGPSTGAEWECGAACPGQPSPGITCGDALNQVQCSYGATTCVCANGRVLCT